jgi:hypothetical protein
MRPTLLAQGFARTAAQFAFTGFALIRVYAFPLPGQSGEPRKLVDSRDAAPGAAQPFSVIGRSSVEQPLFDFDRGETASYATSAQQVNGVRNLTGLAPIRGSVTGRRLTVCFPRCSQQNCQ